MPRQKQRNAALRKHILTTALGLMNEAGVAALTARALASAAGTSVPAIYELFGDKQGLIRAIFFAGFGQLHKIFDALPRYSDSRADLEATIMAFRAFARDHHALAGLMFGRAVATFTPDPEDLDAGVQVRQHIISQVQRCIEANIIQGDPVDIAHVVLGLAQGLALQESAGWLGSTEASMDRRWQLALDTLIKGLSASNVG